MFRRLSLLCVQPSASRARCIFLVVGRGGPPVPGGLGPGSPRGLCTGWVAAGNGALLLPRHLEGDKKRYTGNAHARILANGNRLRSGADRDAAPRISGDAEGGRP